MTQPTLHRREFLTTGFAVSALALSGFGARGATIGRRILPRPFAGSRTISSFASGLFRSEDDMPVELRRAIDAELARTDVPVDSDAKE